MRRLLSSNAWCDTRSTATTIEKFYLFLLLQFRCIIWRCKCHGIDHSIEPIAIAIFRRIVKGIICCERSGHRRIERILQTTIIAILWSYTCLDRRHWNGPTTIYKNSNHTQWDTDTVECRERKIKTKKRFAKSWKLFSDDDPVWVAVNEIRCRIFPQSPYVQSFFCLHSSSTFAVSVFLHLWEEIARQRFYLRTFQKTRLLQIKLCIAIVDTDQFKNLNEGNALEIYRFRPK